MKNKHTPRCPHCGYNFDDEETWYPSDTVGRTHVGDGDESELVCPTCNKKFIVTCIHELIFESEKMEDGDE